MSNKNEVFEYLIDQLRQQVGSNPYKQQCEDLAHEVQSLKNQLRDASALVAELHLGPGKATGGVEDYKLIRKGGYGSEKSGCRKEDTQGWPYSFYYVVTDGSAPSGCRKEDAQECHHNWRFVNGKAPLYVLIVGLLNPASASTIGTFTIKVRR